MKIILNKKAIMMSEVDEAKELAKDYSSWLDNEIIENFANKAVNESCGKLIKINKLEVCKNHYKLTIWADVTMQYFDKFVITSFDLMQANDCNEHIDNCTEIYKKV